MQHHPLIVLKFGSSVLAGEHDVPRAVTEIYRWVRKGWRVLAVVSATAGVTDRLLGQARQYGEHAAPSAVAALAATGELTSAALLALALDRAGVPAEVIDAAAAGLRTKGPTLDAELVSVDAPAIRTLLERTPVVVLPGFIGRDESGRTTLLGRGGSDLTAIALAAALRAECCRLVKDVDGLYERDPALPGPRPRRYATLPWSHAAQIGGKLVQAKAVSAAQNAKQVFEVAALGRDACTRIGDFAAECDSGPGAAVALTPTLRVVLLGCGVVGGGVYAALERFPERFQVVRVVVRTPAKAVAQGVPPELISTDPVAAVEEPADLVIEALGGVEPASAAIARALALGKSVVTANKAVIAARGEALATIARESGAVLSFSAAVGGAVPVLETARRISRTVGVSRIDAVLNGTTNFILQRVGEGAPFNKAIAEAQLAGFAEADPSRDLSGQDAQDKAVLLARAVWGKNLSPDRVSRVGLSAATAGTGSAAGVVRHVVRLWLDEAGEVIASIRPETLDPSDPLARLTRENNGAVFSLRRSGQVVVTGKGAGRWPTAESVLADVLEIAARGPRTSAAADEQLVAVGE